VFACAHLFHKHINIQLRLSSTDQLSPQDLWGRLKRLRIYIILYHGGGGDGVIVDRINTRCRSGVIRLLINESERGDPQKKKKNKTKQN
jgi:hypothetical protein